MKVDAARAKSIFLNASELADPAERAAYLDRECGGDAELRGRVEALLRANDGAPLPPEVGDGTSDHLSIGSGQTQVFDDPTADIGSIIGGRYKLLEEIGEGGMGTVWVAEQTEPVRRKVALKLIKAGMDSKSVLARFEAERQALAVMDHPNIAKVLDGGLTETGRPYFVMEYVKGVPITEYCDATRLSVQERLHLFVQVCQAVQHAHQKGIIHRDLKPSNILVAPYDDLPVPKVIDFGLAKAMHQSLTERTLHTAHETVLGTPLYMSPEQAQLNNIDVDTRSDIYSLGVLLYELLTGTTPLEKQRLKEAAWDEVKRIIREEEPPRPSMRISSAQTLPSLAAGRQIEPARLTKLVRGELDWIVMKSLEKDRARRYETANGFAADVQRYLSGEPVLAAPPSTRYRLRKFARKHRAGLTTAAAIGLLLVAGVAVSAWQTVRATRAEQKALAERDGKEKARQAEETQRKEAETQRDRAVSAEKEAKVLAAVAQAINDFLQKDLLGQADVEKQPGEDGPRDPDIKVRTVLDRAAKAIEGRFASQPRVEAAIRLTIAEAYGALGHEKEVQFHAERSVALRIASLGADHAATLTSQYALAESYYAQGFSERAEMLFREVLEKRTATLGADHLDTLTSKQAMADTYVDQRKFDLAEPLYQEVLQKREAQLGVHHLATLDSKHGLAWLYQMQRKFDLAEALLIELQKAYESTFGEDHPRILNVKKNRGRLYVSQGKYALAEPIYQEVLQKRITLQGPGHYLTLNSMVDLGFLFRVWGKYDRAVPILEEAVAGHKASLGEEHRNTLFATLHLAEAYHDWGKLELALPLFEQTLVKCKESLPPDDFQTLRAMNGLIAAYRAARMPEKAVTLCEQALTKLKEKTGIDDPATLRAMGTLARTLLEARQPEKALPLFREYFDRLRNQLGAESVPFATLLAQNSHEMLKHQHYPEAESLLRECLAIREKTEPDVWTTFYTQSLLGGALLGQKKYADAEPLLQAGYEGMKQREKSIPAQGSARIPETIDRLIELYTATGKPDEVTKLQSEREKFPLATAPATENK